MKYLILILSIYTIHVSSLFAGENTTPLFQQSNYYYSLKKSEKIRVHFLLLKIISDRSLETTYDIPKVISDRVTLTTPATLEKLLGLIANSAIAQEHLDPPYCHYGGWLSTYNASNECQSPWNRAVRNQEQLKNFGPTYNSAYSCGGANLFRCNPMLYGPSIDGDPKGQCVVTDDRSTFQASFDCFETFKNDPQRIENFFSSLENDPNQLAKYLAVVAETLRFCNEENNQFSLCSGLSSFFEEKTKDLMACYDQENLYDSLPGIVTPLNRDQLDEIAHNLGANFTSYFEELKRREQEIRDENMRLYQQGFDQFSNDPRTIAINQRMRDNSTRCLLGTCVGSKPAGHSKERCARYVKLGFFPVRGGASYADQSKPWNEQYPWNKDAVESGPWLEEMGYENAMDIDALSHLTPENAPVGAVIVYEDTTPSRNYNVNGEVIGGPGHIEIKTGEAEYISDFKTSTPTRIGGARVPIGIYIQIPDEIKSQITQLPGS